MPFCIRPMTAYDLHRCARVERESFPSLFSPTSFGRELTNPQVSYLVADTVTNVLSAENILCEPQFGNPANRMASGASASTGWSKSEKNRVVGFIGIWYMADEANIVNVGVSIKRRGEGVGELLLIAAIEQALARNSRMIALEVRQSNFVARNLYRKYSFRERGLRKGYYSDNREDAVTMTTDHISSVAFSERFANLVAAHRLVRGSSIRIID